MNKLILFTCLIFVFAQSSHAQFTDFQTWGQITSTTSLDSDKNWLLFLEAQGRLADDVTNLERTLVRPALGYRLNPNLSFYLGYAWTPTYIDSNYDDDFRNEHRIWQQAVINHKLFGLDIMHRIRQEQRFISNASSVANRTRYLIKASYSLSGEYGLSAYNELFVNLHGVKRGPKGGVDRYRVFAGPYLKKQGVIYELGYLGELGQEFRGDDRMINALYLGIHLNH